MADPLVPPPSGESTYRPVSGFAVAGFGVGLLFAILVGISTLVALLKGVPIFLPAWTLLFALLGLVLSFVGQREIANSEGTRAGAPLARYGIWLCIITGLGYLAYSYVTGLALTTQANNFLVGEKTLDSGFFPHLQKASADPVDLRTAFLLTRPETARRGISPQDEQGFLLLMDQPRLDRSPDSPKATTRAGPFSEFKQNFLVRTFGKGVAGQVQVDPQGVQDWRYEAGHYVVVRNYRIRSPELDMIVRVAVQSVEPEDTGKSRTWFVDLTQTERAKIDFTALGRGLDKLRNSARAALDRWAQGLNAGNSYDLDIEQTDWNRLVGPEQRAPLREAIVKLFKSQDVGRLPFEMARRHDGIGDWDLSPQKQVRFEFPFRLHPNGTDIVLEGSVFVQSQLPLDPADPPATEPEWTIAGVVITRAAVVEMPRPKR